MKNGISVALGTALFGTSISQKDAFSVLDKYSSLGGRIIDTSNNYAYWESEGKGGESESVIGSWLKGQERSVYTIMTKVGSLPVAVNGNQPILEGLSPDAVEHAVTRSLTRLKTDYIDILLAHHDDRNTPLLHTWQAFSRLIETGKVRKIGVSNYSPERIQELSDIISNHSLHPIECVQLKYSIIAPLENANFDKLVVFDMEMKKTLNSLAPNAVIFAYSPLLGGKIFDEYSEAEWPAEYDSMKNRRKVQQIQYKSKKLGVVPSALVLKQIADQGIIPITATGKIERLETNLKLLI